MPRSSTQQTVGVGNDMPGLFRLLSLLGQQQVPSQSDDALRALSILMRHRDKNFVQRALYPDQSKTYDDGKGFHGTHYMGWTTIRRDGKDHHIVYPNIVERAPNAGLEMLSGADAVRYAIKSGEYIPFDDPKEADWFSQKYKSIWDFRRSLLGGLR